MGLLKTPETEEPKRSASNEALKDPSPFKDLMATMEKPADLTAHPGSGSAFQHYHQNVISPPKSADCVSKKTTFFQVKKSPKASFFILDFLYIKSHTIESLGTSYDLGTSLSQL